MPAQEGNSQSRDKHLAEMEDNFELTMSLPFYLERQSEERLGLDILILRTNEELMWRCTSHGAIWR